jgi:hypothetical protein
MIHSAPTSPPTATRSSPPSLDEATWPASPIPGSAASLRPWKPPRPRGRPPKGKITPLFSSAGRSREGDEALSSCTIAKHSLAERDGARPRLDPCGQPFPFRKSSRPPAAPAPQIAPASTPEGRPRPLPPSTSLPPRLNPPTALKKPPSLRPVRAKRVCSHPPVFTFFPRPWAPGAPTARRSAGVSPEEDCPCAPTPPFAPG